MKADSPQANIRRFDVFAEWSRLVGSEKKHLHAEDARRYGIAVAKLVAARKFAGYEPGLVSEWRKRARDHEREEEEPWWEHLAPEGEFERKIVERMGRDFYRQTFQPAIRSAWEEGQSYEQIRDALRKQWNESLLRAA